jgi:hypothetical protein
MQQRSPPQPALQSPARCDPSSVDHGAESAADTTTLLSSCNSPDAQPCPPPLGASASDADGGRTFATTPLRAAALAQLCLCSWNNGLQWIVFSNVVAQTQRTFGISAVQVDSLLSFFYFAFIAFAFVAITIFDMRGTRVSLIVASSCNLAGGLLKLLATWYPSYALLLVSQLVAGTAQCFFLPVPAALSAAWFGDDERTLATTIASISNPLGGAAGLLLVTLFVNETHGDAAAFRSLFTALSIVNAVDFALAVVLPHGPPSPPSRAAEVRQLVTQRNAEVPLCERLVRIAREGLAPLRDLDSAMLLFGAGTAAACYWTLTTLFAQITSPFGVSQQTVGVVGLLNVVVGIPVGIVVSRLVDARRMYKPVQLVTMGCIVFFVALMVLLLLVAPDSAALHAPILYVVLGAAQNLILPIAFEAAAETTFPLCENVAGASVLMVAEVMAVVLSATLPQLFSIASMTARDSAVVVVCVLLAGNVVALCAVLRSRVFLRRPVAATTALALAAS